MAKPGDNAERLVVGRLILALRTPEQESDVLLIALRDSDQKRGNHIAWAPIENGLLHDLWQAGIGPALTMSTMASSRPCATASSRLCGCGAL